MSNTLSNKAYDVLKFIAQIALPAAGTAYLGLAALWPELPDPDAVVGTIVVVDTLLGTLLGLSTKQYNNSDEKYDGHINMITTPTGKTVADMQLNKVEDPSDLVNQSEVLFKVNNPPVD